MKLYQISPLLPMDNSTISESLSLFPQTKLPLSSRWFKVVPPSTVMSTFTNHWSDHLHNHECHMPHFLFSLRHLVLWKQNPHSRSKSTVIDQASSITFDELLPDEMIEIIWRCNAPVVHPLYSYPLNLSYCIISILGCMSVVPKYMTSDTHYKY